MLRCIKEKRHGTSVPCRVQMTVQRHGPRNCCIARAPVLQLVRNCGRRIIVTSLHWLPEVKDWRERLRALPADSERAWTNAVGLANARLDFVRTNGLDEALRRTIGIDPPGGLAAKPVPLAILGSSTFAHLHPSLRIAGVRRNMHVTAYENDYGQYWQELVDVGSALHAFKPTVVLLALDAQHLAAGVSAAMDAEAVAAELQDVAERVRTCWQMIRDAFGCQILFQMPLPVHPPLLGSNEHRLPGSPSAFIARLSEALRPMADAAGVDLLALDARAALDGPAAWHDPALWHRAKQEVSPAAAPMHGELVLRLIAARLGRSAKCLVLDLDNTLWGGVIGDDGLEGIVLGQGSALGEAYAAFQAHARELARRGVILAVCSKNDEAVALEPFERHPEMVLRRDDIASFVANWSDKAGNIRAIARGAEHRPRCAGVHRRQPVRAVNLVRQELPVVAVPEVTDDPAGFARTLADAGYFEALCRSPTKTARGRCQYQGNRAREALRTRATDLPTYLRGLEMRLRWRRFDATGLQRIVQLINKTNQFNLTTRRYTEAEVQDRHAATRARSGCSCA